MKKSTKIIITVISVIVLFILTAVISGLRQEAGFSTPGFLGIILFAGFLGGMRAIWKKR
jgi:hypothetical protein